MDSGLYTRFVNNKLIQPQVQHKKYLSISPVLFTAQVLGEVLLPVFNSGLCFII